MVVTEGPEPRKYTESVPCLCLSISSHGCPCMVGICPQGSPGPPHCPGPFSGVGAAVADVVTAPGCWGMAALHHACPSTCTHAPVPRGKWWSQPFSPHPSLVPGLLPGGAQRGTSNSGFISLGQAQGLFP